MTFLISKSSEVISCDFRNLKYFLDTKVKGLKTAVLVDRNHKKYPIKSDFKGLSLSTSIQSKVEVIIDEKKIEAFLV